MESSEELVDKDGKEYREEVKNEMVPLKGAESIEKEESGDQRIYFAKFSNHELNHWVPSDMNHEITQKSDHSIRIIKNYQKSHIKIEGISSLDNYSKDVILINFVFILSFLILIMLIFFWILFNWDYWFKL